MVARKIDMDFRSLHFQSEPVLICNVWDVSSAVIAEQAGYQCIGTSSAAISGMLGYSDGEDMSFSELHDLVAKIKSRTTIPLTVDIEAGYGETVSEIYENIKALTEIGVAGVNIEDSVVIGGKRVLKDPYVMENTISGLVELLRASDISIFLNSRTDAYLVKNDTPLEETKRRISLYQKAGADGIFVPFLEEKEDIKVLAEFADLPLNVMCTRHLPDFRTLTELGVKRISMGNYAYSRIYKKLKKDLLEVADSQSFAPLFSNAN
jgi:2-methylisocitrate lyase-like PEP mutase family enzyme